MVVFGWLVYMCAYVCIHNTWHATTHCQHAHVSTYTPPCKHTTHVPHPPPQLKTWKVSADLFPCPLDTTCTKLLDDAVAAAVGAWGERQLTELDAEERLSIACEKAPTDDDVTKKVRMCVWGVYVYGCVCRKSLCV